MTRTAEEGKKRFLRLPGSRPVLLWGSAAVLLSLLLLLLLFFNEEKSRKPAQIPAEVLSKIDQEKADARKAHADFIQTPAGKLWQKYPYWSPDMCQRVVDGLLSPGMSMDQAREAVNRVAEVRKKKGNLSEWMAEGRNGETLILRFDGNALMEVERSKR